MAKTIDVNERTLEQEKASFLKMCRFFEALANIFRIGIIVCLIMMFFSYIGSFAGWVDAEKKLTSEEGWVTFASLCVSGIGYVIALNFGVAIFRSLRTAETPFRYDIGDKMKGAGITLAVTGVVGFVFNLTVNGLITNGVLDIDAMNNAPDTVPFLFGVFLTALAYVFNYGCKLQQEADETI